MIKSSSIYRCVIIALLISSITSPVYAIDKQSSQTLNKAMVGIIKAAGKVSINKVCEAVLPKVFCEVVVDPVLSAIYEDFPFLKPNNEDSQEQLNKKAAITIQQLQENKKYQQMMLSNFKETKKEQKVIITKINKLGTTQAEILESIHIILSYQKDIKEGVDELVDKQRKEDKDKLLDKKAEVMTIWYKAYNLSEKRKHLLELLKARGDSREQEFTEVQKDISLLEESKAVIESKTPTASGSPNINLESLGKIRVLLNQYILIYEERNEFLKEDLEKLRKKQGS